MLNNLISSQNVQNLKGLTLQMTVWMSKITNSVIMPISNEVA